MLKPLTIALAEPDFQRWKNLQCLPGQAWKFWKEIFGRHPMLKSRDISGTPQQILSMRYVKGAEFRIDYADRKLPQKAIKAAKDMDTRK